MKTVTDKQVLEFLRAKALELSQVAPGYVSIRADAVFLPSTMTEPEASFVTYNEHAGHSPKMQTAAKAIESTGSMVNGRTEAEIIRIQIKELEKKAAALEAKDSLTATDPIEAERHV